MPVIKTPKSTWPNWADNDAPPSLSPPLVGCDAFDERLYPLLRITRSQCTGNAIDRTAAGNRHA